MYRMNIPDTRKYTKENRRRRMWRRILSAMASIVVFCTTYALILPAITLEAQPSPEAMEAIVQTQLTEETVAPETVLAEPEVPPAQVTPGGGTVSADAPEVEESTTASTEPTTEPTAEPTQAPTEAPTEPPMAEPEEIVDEELTQSGVSDEPVSGDPAAVDLAGDGEQTDASTTAPLDVTDYITGATLQYQVNGGEWKNVVDAENIPGNAVFQLDVTYGNVPIETLKNAGYQMTYKLPDLLRDAVASGNLTDSNKNQVGTIEASGNLVTLKFDEKWIADLTQPSKSEQDNPQEGQTTQKQQVLNGTFYVQATANLSNIPEGGSTSITIGKVNININFEGDILAKHADITLTKSGPELDQTENGDYLEYTLTVKAGQDECLGVYVEDEITSNAEQVEQYCGFEPTDSVEVSADGKSFTWTIGNMAANETRTLTYRVKLKKDFLGGKLDKQVITNKATPYTQVGEKSYEHTPDSKSFIADGQATLSKVSKEYDPETSTIQYTIWVQALDTNTYTLEHVYIKDALDGTVTGGNVTDENVRKYLSYVKDSFKLYEGGTEKQNGTDGLTLINEKVEPTFGENTEPHNTNFTYDIGSLGVGECRTLTYKIKVEPGAFMAANNTEIKVLNRATISDNKECVNNRFNNYNCDETIGKKAWSRKMVGEAMTEAETIAVSGDVYDTDGKTKLDSSPESFTVPAGSYRYQIIANEAGDWDLSSAVMTDALHGDYLQYVGYVQVSAYKINEVSTSPAGKYFGTNDQAMEEFSKKTAEKTVWVKIAGERSFDFSPINLGMKEQYAYVLTYYAKVIKHGATNVVVANDFILTGKVGYGGVEYELAGITARGEVTVSSNNYFAAQKRFWYYDRATEEDGKGTLYWILQIDGASIQKDIQIKDAISGTNHGDLKTVGIYKSSIELTADMTVADLKEVEKVSEDIVTTEKSDNGSLVYTIKEDLTMNQTEGNKEHLYIIVSSVPKVLPTSSWKNETYINGLYTKSEVQMDWTLENVVSQTIFGGTEIIKELGEIFTYVPNETTPEAEGTKTTIGNYGALHPEGFPMQWDYLTEGGIYVSWHIRVNQGGTLNGTYRVLETIPDGMECVYLIKASAPGSGSSSQFVKISDAESKGWEKVSKTYPHAVYYKEATYYVKDQQVMWDMSLQLGDPTANCFTEFQIVCKVTDPEVLQSGIKKTFTNTVSMTNEDSVQIGVDSDAVTIWHKSLSKKGNYNSDINGGVYPFQITVNDLGTDLVPGSDTIKLIDELSDTLILDPTSIRVVNSKTEKEVSCTPSVDGQVLTLELPDNQPLTITYNATINAAPGQKISISNKAYWEGYATSGGSSVKESDFSYAGGTVDTGVTPTLTIIKLDQNNATLKLSGAEFKLEEVGEDLQPKDNGLSLTGTTNKNGTLTFGKSGDKLLSYNTIYCLTETKAPEGYVLDNKPHYFAICDGKETDIPKTEVVCYYVSPNYVYSAYNHKGEAEVKKVFQNAGGEKLEKIDGTYKFGIFKANDVPGKENLVQTVYITFKSGEVNSGTAKFTNLDLNATYTIYELDDKGNRIEAGTSAVVSGMPFVVSYSENQKITVTEEVSTVTVTNRMNYAELPATGGPGPGALYLSGLALIFAALVLLKKRKTA